MNDHTSIRFCLLKPPGIFVDGALCSLPYKKAEALLYYLAIEKKVTRDQAATLLWESCDETTAKKNLRHAVYTIKKILGPDIILAEGHQLLILNRELPLSIDYDVFLEKGLTDAYQGELLKGFYLRHTLAFEDWLQGKRDYVLGCYLKLISRRLEQLSVEDTEEAEQLFEQYIAHEAFDEEVYRLMMELYEKRGLYFKGIRLYQKLSARLEKELAASPGRETALIYKRLLHHMNAAAEKPETAKLLPPDGREQELMFLLDAFGGFLSGTPSAILLTGENGSGKTYLAEHFLKLTKGPSILTLRVSCLETEQSILLQPFNTIMLKLDLLIKKRELQIESKYMEAAACLFPMFGSLDADRLFPEDVSISYSYRTTRNLLLKFFYTLSDQIPLLFFFDNINFMDSASLDLLLQLIRSRSRNIMVVTACPEPLSEAVFTSLQPLVKENMLNRYYISPYFHRDGEERTAENCIPEESGNFTTYTLNKISALSADARQLLSLLSACQSRGDFQLFEDLLEQSPLRLLDICDELKAMNILTEAKEEKHIYFSFRNNSVRKAVYEQLPPSRRRYFHEKLADHLTGLGGSGASHYECLIYHYVQAENEALELKCRILLLEEYTKRYYELYPMQYASGQDKESDVRSFPEYCGRLEERLLSLDQTALNRINAPRAYISLLRTKAQYCIAQGKYEDGLESVNKALLLNRQNGNEPLIRIRCLRLVNFYRLNLWKIKDLEASLLECLKLGEEFGFREEFAIDCRLYGLFAAMNGDYKKSLRYLRKSLRIFSDFPMKSRIYTINIAACYNYMGETYRKQKQFEKAVAAYERAISLSQGTPCPGGAVFYSNLARALKAMGQTESSAQTFYLADEIYNDSAALIGRSITKGYVSILEAEKGDFASARNHILQAVESAEQLASPHSMGLLAYARFTLREKYPEAFENVLPALPSEYRNEAIRCLKEIPGIYELDELL